MENYRQPHLGAWQDDGEDSPGCMLRRMKKKKEMMAGRQCGISKGF